MGRLDLATMTFPVRAGGLLLAMAADAAFADPARGHPVAGFGRAATALERRLYRDDRRAGAAFTTVAVGLPLLGAGLVQFALRNRPVWATVALAAATWATLGGTSLGREGAKMSALLAADDLAAARARLAYLCARDASGLDPAELTRATVESLAENTSDAVVGPLFWGAVAGLPGVVGYRAINTLDAMVGYRNARYRHFGWASARLDDAVNLLPARITAALAVLLAPAIGGSARPAARVLRRDGGHHPSPNAGRCEAAFAGALGVSLGGTNTYGDVVEDRGRLGDGPAPTRDDIARTARLAVLLGWAVAGLAAICSCAVSKRWPRKTGWRG
jgi:adenosylcobinamide-phosphate synthase